MTDFKWFLLCVFSFILLITGLFLYEFTTYKICRDLCGGGCGEECLNYSDKNVSFETGIVLMVLGFVIVLCSCPIVTRRLTNRSSGDKRNARAELTEVVEKADTDELTNLREQLKAKTDQVQALTERLSQYEKLPQETIIQQTSARETHPLGNESKNTKSE
jgi:hypothetical protein